MCLITELSSAPAIWPHWFCDSFRERYYRDFWVFYLWSCQHYIVFLSRQKWSRNSHKQVLVWRLFLAPKQFLWNPATMKRVDSATQREYGGIVVVCKLMQIVANLSYLWTCRLLNKLRISHNFFCLSCFRHLKEEMFCLPLHKAVIYHVIYSVLFTLILK